MVIGLLIEQTRTDVGGQVTYSFEGVFLFWIVASLVSLGLALLAWSGFFLFVLVGVEAHGRKRVHANGG